MEVFSSNSLTCGQTFETNTRKKSTFADSCTCSQISVIPQSNVCRNCRGWDQSSSQIWQNCKRDATWHILSDRTIWLQSETEKYHDMHFPKICVEVHISEFYRSTAQKYFNDARIYVYIYQIFAWDNVHGALHSVSFSDFFDIPEKQRIVNLFMEWSQRKASKFRKKRWKYVYSVC
jgi:hypothetical protein